MSELTRRAVAICAAVLSLITIGSAQREIPGSQLRSLNNQLLQVYAQLQALPAGERAAASNIRSQASTVISRRSAALESLIERNPSQALSLAFSEDLLSNLRRAFPQSALQLEESGHWEGSVEFLVEDGADLKSHREIQRLSTGKETLDIHFGARVPDNLQSGDILQVHGIRAGTQVAADGGTVTGSVTGPAAMCTPIGEQRSLVLLVTMPGVAPPPTSTASVADIFFANTGRSVSEFWRENSYGATWATGDVKGWYTLDASYTCDQASEIRDAAIRAVDSSVDFTKYSRIFLVVSGIDGSCGWAGLGTVGCSSLSSAGDGPFTASTAWMLSSMFNYPSDGVKLSIHEGGHNLGLNHSSSRDFDNEVLGAPGAAGILSEYGDEFSTMGNGNFGHYAAPQKAKLGWIASDLLTITATGSFAIAPMETPGALHALKIRRGTDDNNWLWLEYRRPLGVFDSSLGTQIFNGALIHYQDLMTGDHTHLLDFTPETSSWSDPALLQGRSWVDPYTNVSISVDSVTSTALNASVNYGILPCVEGIPTVAISPQDPSAYPGDNVTYAVAVTSNDSSSCGSRTFNLSSLAPNWATNFSQDSVVLSPGTTASVAMLKSVPPNTAPATYEVDTSVLSSSSPVDGTANVTVMPPPCVTKAPTVTLSPATLNALPGDTVSYTVDVTNNDGTSCSPRTTSLSSTLPAGWTTSFSQNSVTFAPSVTVSITMSKQVPTDALPATYSVDVWGSSSDGSVQAKADVTVVSPLPTPPPCVSAAPQLGISPSSLSAFAGDRLNYTITITNNDSSSCAPRQFDLSSNVPAWTTSFSQSSLMLSPASMASSQMTKVVPAGTNPGTYAVEALITNNSSSTKVTASITVQPPPLTVTLSMPKTLFTRNSTVSITAKVMQGTVAGIGASVIFTLTGPGGTVTQTATADSTGSVTWAYRVSAKDPKGSYSVTAKATLGSQTAVSSPVTFSVQ
jgi:M6 family metalloprotease-like protein/uncharacterized repeat protein (TIGR01451 family)